MTDRAAYHTLTGGEWWLTKRREILMSSLEDFKQRLRETDNYHLEERAKRLEEIGGPGVGGLELRYSPSFIKSGELVDEEDEKKMTVLALQDSIHERWCEATSCYVNGHFRSCVIILASLVETSLKLELEWKDIPYGEITLGGCIKLCMEKGILPNGENASIIHSLKRINKSRNDVIHANIERRAPASLIHYTGNEHESEPVQDISKNISGDGAITGNGETISIHFGKETKVNKVYPFKAAARKTLEETREVFKFLYSEPVKGCGG